MPFQNGLDPMTFGWMEWGIIGGVVFLIILMHLLLILRRRKTSVKVGKVSTHTKSGVAFRCEATNEAIVVRGENAWLADSHGMTELLRAIDGPKVKLAGKVVYFAKEIKKISVSQEGDQLKRGQTFERQYVTLDFISDIEIKLGTRLFVAEEALRARDEKQKIAEAKAAKIQAKVDEKTAKEEEKAAKIRAKEEAKLAKENAKLAKKMKKSQDD